MNTVMNAFSGSIKYWEILEWLHNWQLHKKGSSFIELVSYESINKIYYYVLCSSYVG
jgi:hypothetical protein